ncbi:MAG: hypothetical protein JWQ43_3209 [Glaciihabitans sp.]|nr:hypothetical protein [Glaciihabitans sp.]
MRIDNKEGIRILQLDPEGPVISSAQNTSDLIGNAWMEHVDVIGIPVARLDPKFFRLDSLFAGEIIQKAVNYGVKLAVIGDISRFESSSDAFRAFVGESNRGEHVWFVPTENGLDEKL